MTTSTDRLIRLIFFIGGLPFLYFIFSRAEANWLYYTSLSFIFIGIVYGLIADWMQGKKSQVKKRLLFYVALVVILFVIALLKNSG